MWNGTIEGTEEDADYQGPDERQKLCEVGEKGYDRKGAEWTSPGPVHNVCGIQIYDLVLEGGITGGGGMYEGRDPRPASKTGEE